jgi:hypothetical protein
MSIVKNVSSPYIVHTINRDDPIILDAGNVIINGNLTVRYTAQETIIETVNTNVYDNIIQLNSGNYADPPASSLTSGVEVFRGNNRPTMQLLWFEGSEPPAWKFSEETYDGVNYNRVFYNATHYNATLGGYNMANVACDPAPYIGGNLDIGNLSIFSSNTGSTRDANTWSANVRIDSNLALQKYVATTTSVTPNHITLMASNVSTGGTGLYVTADEQGIQHEELISKRRAIIYSIIF